MAIWLRMEAIFTHWDIILEELEAIVTYWGGYRDGIAAHTYMLGNHKGRV